MNAPGVQQHFASHGSSTDAYMQGCWDHQCPVTSLWIAHVYLDTNTIYHDMLLIFHTSPTHLGHNRSLCCTPRSDVSSLWASTPSHTKLCLWSTPSLRRQRFTLWAMHASTTTVEVLIACATCAGSFHSSARTVYCCGRHQELQERHFAIAECTRTNMSRRCPHHHGRAARAPQRQFSAPPVTSPPAVKQRYICANFASTSFRRNAQQKACPAVIFFQPTTDRQVYASEVQGCMCRAQGQASSHVECLQLAMTNSTAQTASTNAHCHACGKLCSRSGQGPAATACTQHCALAQMPAPASLPASPTNQLCVHPAPAVCTIAAAAGPASSTQPAPTRSAGTLPARRDVRSADHRLETHHAAAALASVSLP